MAEPAPKFLSLGVDYLGFLNAELRDLRGFRTLANELVQNANDAKGATWVRFDACDDALIVENNGVFSDCGEVEHPICPWHADRGHLCDFHRFRRTASGDKRREANTTGAFGIGFISVYQITDHPELFSGERRWIIRPEKTEAERIRVDDASLPCPAGTQFRLPWAFEESDLRIRLGVECVPSDAPDRFVEEVRDHIRTLVLFLREVEVVELCRNGTRVARVERRLQAEFGLSLVCEGERVERWKLLRASFAPQATVLRERHGAQIEDKRSADVAVAIPIDQIDQNGHLYATLPTEQQLGMPLVVNADFFPSSDRKRVLFDADYQGTWNSAAIEAAAAALAANLEEVRSLLSAVSFWRLAESVREVKRRTEKGEVDAVFGKFWDRIGPALSNGPFILASKGDWRRATEVLLLQSVREETPAIPVLTALDVPIVHPDLAPYYNLLREIGVRPLAALDIAAAMKRQSFDRPIQLGEAPDWLRDPRGVLLDELDRLLQRATRDQVVAVKEELSACSLARTRDGLIAPPEMVRQADDATQRLFAEAMPNIRFLVADSHPIVGDLVERYSIDDAIDALESMGPGTLSSVWAKTPKKLLSIIEWFRDRRAEMTSSTQRREKLAKLRMWPTGDTLYELGELSVPGDFIDPLGLAHILDERVVACAGSFLTEILGAMPLTLGTYVTQHIPRALTSGHDFSAASRLSLFRLLAENVGKLENNPEARIALSGCAIVPAAGGQFWRPSQVYFGSDLVREVLGSDVPLVQVPADLTGAGSEILRWLGVVEIPRGTDIVARIESIVANDCTPATRGQIQAIFSAVGSSWEKLTSSQAELEQLKQLRWLPSRSGEGWCVPNEIFATYQSHLFETQARFLDIDQHVQGRTRAFIDFLDVQINPSVEQVVNHLLHCSHNATEVNPDVYRHLSRMPDTPAVARLRTHSCLHLGGGKYERPNRVFWNERRFGRYRNYLSAEWREFQKLLDQLQVRDSADATDALAVLHELADEFGPMNIPLDDEAHAVALLCWRLLDDATGENFEPTTLSALHELKVVPDRRRVLTGPDRVFFEDRPRLAEKFSGFLDFNVIPRPDGAWRAMLAAGVRYLSLAVEEDLVEYEPVGEDPDLTTLLQSRSELIRRVLGDNRESGIDLASLRQMTVTAASRLMRVYRLRAFNQIRQSVAEEAAVYLDKARNCICVVKSRGVPWAAVARELAYAINPLGEAGPLAAAIKEVLSAESEGDATVALDDLGFAPATETVSTSVPDHAAVSVGEGLTGPSSSASSNGEVEDAGGPSSADTVTGDNAADTGDGQATGPISAGADPGAGAQSGTATGSGSTGGAPIGAGGGQSGPRQGGTTRSRAGVILRSYVRGAGTGGAPAATGTSAPSAVDHAGLDKVLQYERSHGRIPTEMSHSHPGYDVESRENGQPDPVRLIEVKSLAGAWDELGAGISSTQYECARAEGDKFWLYVVENALGPAAVIHAFQNPADKIVEYRFDDGWKAFVDEKETIRRRSILDLKNTAAESAQWESTVDEETASDSEIDPDDAEAET